MGIKILEHLEAEYVNDYSLSTVCRENKNLKLDHFRQITPETNLIINGPIGPATLECLACRVPKNKEEKPSGAIIFASSLDVADTENKLKELAIATGRALLYMPWDRPIAVSQCHNQIRIESKEDIDFLKVMPEDTGHVRVASCGKALCYNTNQNSDEEDRAITAPESQHMQEIIDYTRGCSMDHDRAQKIRDQRKIGEIATLLGHGHDLFIGRTLPPEVQDSFKTPLSLGYSRELATALESDAAAEQKRSRKEGKTALFSFRR